MIIASLLVGLQGYSVGAQEVIVNKSVSKTSIDKHALKSIFSMNLLTWPDGSPIRVFVLPGKNPVHISFSKKVLDTLPHNLQRTWDRLVFSGTGQSPEIVSSEKEMVEKISSVRGAIGYVDNMSRKEEIKVLYVH